MHSLVQRQLIYVIHIFARIRRNRKTRAMNLFGWEFMDAVPASAILNRLFYHLENGWHRK